MATKQGVNTKKYEAQRLRTKANKIKRITLELERNPNNVVASQTLQKLQAQK